jgi:hypothetical protein
MAEGDGTGGAERWAKLRPPPPDWEEWTRETEAELIAEGAPEAEARIEAERMCGRMKLRHAWFRERFEAFLEMQDRAGKAYVRYMDAHPEIDWGADDAPEVPEPFEEAVAKAIYEEVIAAVKKDRWPRHLHFGDV